MIKFIEYKNEVYTVSEFAKKFNLSIPSVYRKLAKGLDAEDILNFDKSKTKPKFYRGKQLKYPDNLILDLLDNNFKYDIGKIKSEFEKNFETMLSENANFFTEKELDILNLRYKESYTYGKIAEEYGVSKQYIEKVISNLLAVFRRPYFSDYYIMGLDFVRIKENYAETRRKELADQILNNNFYEKSR